MAPAGFVYLILAGNRHKIGTSADPQRRLRELAGDAHDAEILHVIPSAQPFRVEGVVQSYFAAKRIKGEWFSLDAADVALIRSITTADDVDDLPEEMRAAGRPGGMIRIDPDLARMLAVIASVKGASVREIVSPVLRPILRRMCAELLPQLERLGGTTAGSTPPPADP